MEELVIQHGQRASTTEPSSSTHFSQLGSSSTMNAISEGWKCIYTIKDIVSCIEKIQPVRYTESQTLFSTLRLVAFSSGYSLGSANWLMETSFKKIVFLSWSSFHSDLHPSPFDAAILKNANVIIVSGLSTLTERDLFFERAKTKVLAQTGNLF
jgi:integrator complex subunit 9